MVKGGILSLLHYLSPTKTDKEAKQQDKRASQTEEQALGAVVRRFKDRFMVRGGMLSLLHPQEGLMSGLSTRH